MEGINDINPSLAIWEITLKCNLKCKHCGSSAGKTRKNELTTDECLKICEELSEIGFKGITLFGGEPFLREDWHIIARKIKDLGMKISVVTNGFVNTDDIIPKLVNLKVDSVQVGLDGSTAETHDNIRGVKGSFSKAINFLDLLKNADIPSGAITTVSKMNFKELPAIKNLIFSKGFDWQIQEAIPIGRFPRDMVLPEEEYYALGLFIADCKNKSLNTKINVSSPHNMGFFSKYLSDLGSINSWNGCWAGKKTIGIQSDGGVKGCLALSDDFIEGNLRNRNIIDIWNDPNFCRFNRNFNKKNLGKNCINCKYVDLCKGGCSTRSYSFTKMVRNDPYCFYRIEKEII